MYPLQGGWSVEQYLALDGGLMVEYTDGFVRVLPMPSLLHQLIAKFVFQALDRYVSERSLGEVLFAPLPVELTPTQYREPDVVFLRPDRIRTMKGHPSGADLVVEVVSEGKENRDRDYIDKRAEYAAAGIAEYWIADPEQRTVTVLTLDGESYREHATFGVGETMDSVLLEGLTLEISEVFSKCDEHDS